MTKTELGSLSIDELVERFAEICIAQGEKLYNFDTRGYKPLYRAMKQVDFELRERGVEARQALVRLYDHPNLHVRLQAARCSYGVDPVAARRCLEALRDSGCPPQCYHAGMCLASLDDGTGHLT